MLNRKNIVYLLLFLLLYFSFILISWQFVKKEEKEYISQIEFIGSEEFLFDGEVLQVKEMNVEIPEGWIEEKGDKKISFYSSDNEGACKVSIQAGRVEKEGSSPTIAEHINTMIDNADYEELQKPGVITHEPFFTDSSRGLKTVFTLENNTSYIILEIPHNNIIYILESDFIFSEDCKESFNNIINNITIL